MRTRPHSEGILDGLPDGQINLSKSERKRICPAPSVKINFVFQKYSFDVIPKSVALIRPFHPNEGRLAIATNAGWNAMDADVSHGVRQTRGRSSRVVLKPLGWFQICRLATSTLRVRRAEICR